MLVVRRRRAARGTTHHTNRTGCAAVSFVQVRVLLHSRLVFAFFLRTKPTPTLGIYERTHAEPTRPTSTKCHRSRVQAPENGVLCSLELPSLGGEVTRSASITSGTTRPKGWRMYVLCVVWLASLGARPPCTAHLPSVLCDLKQESEEGGKRERCPGALV